MMSAMATGLFAVTIVLTVLGWRRVPGEARFPVSCGVPPAVEGTMGKRTGLVTFLVIGSFLLVTTLVAASQEHPIGWVGVGLMLFFILMEYGLIQRLSGRRQR